MNRMCCLENFITRNRAAVPLAALLALLPLTEAVARSTKTIVVPKWGRFEVAFKSSATYANPVSEATLNAVFISPTGESNRVYGFWDGGKVWRVRFSPTLPGRWTYTTTCSDEANAGLANQSGEFICTAALNKTMLDRRGPLQVARERRHFEHADGRPFLWLGDSAGEGARRSDLDDWQLYAGVRAQQRFTAVHWSVAPGPDAKGETAFTRTNGLAINVNFFQRLDAKVDALNRAGLVSAIVPLQELGPATDPLPEDQATLLVRYIVARWGAHHVAWLLAFEGDSLGKNVQRWKHIGRAVFGEGTHAPVILLPGETHWLLDEFRNENWVDAFGFPSTAAGDDALQWMFTGPLSVEWQKKPTRPLLNLTPPAEAMAEGDDARRLLWWNALLVPTAGASYAALPVMNWTTNATTNPNTRPQNLPQWREALFLPGSKNVTIFAEFLGTIDYWRLRPVQNILPEQPGAQAPRRHIATAKTEKRDLAVIYVPEDRGVDILIPEMPPTPGIIWFNPRTGERTTAVGLIGGYSCQFPTPTPGDWVLLLKTRN